MIAVVGIAGVGTALVVGLADGTSAFVLASVDSPVVDTAPVPDVPPRHWTHPLDGN